jgi:hypothetical protein
VLSKKPNIKLAELEFVSFKVEDFYLNCIASVPSSFNFALANEQGVF